MSQVATCNHGTSSMRGGERGRGRGLQFEPPSLYVFFILLQQSVTLVREEEGGREGEGEREGGREGGERGREGGRERERDGGVSDGGRGE